MITIKQLQYAPARAPKNICSRRHAGGPTQRLCAPTACQHSLRLSFFLPEQRPPTDALKQVSSSEQQGCSSTCVLTNVFRCNPIRPELRSQSRSVSSLSSPFKLSPLYSRKPQTINLDTSKDEALHSLPFAGLGSGCHDHCPAVQGQPQPLVGARLEKVFGNFEGE